mgnify:CR=1 FL=1
MLLLAILLVCGTLFTVSTQKTDYITIPTGISMVDLDMYVSIYSIGQF